MHLHGECIYTYIHSLLLGEGACSYIRVVVVVSYTERNFCVYELLYYYYIVHVDVCNIWNMDIQIDCVLHTTSGVTRWKYLFEKVEKGFPFHPVLRHTGSSTIHSLFCFSFVLWFFLPLTSVRLTFSSSSLCFPHNISPSVLLIFTHTQLYLWDIVIFQSHFSSHIRRVIISLPSWCTALLCFLSVHLTVSLPALYGAFGFPSCLSCLIGYVYNVCCAQNVISFCTKTNNNPLLPTNRPYRVPLRVPSSCVWRLAASISSSTPDPFVILCHRLQWAVTVFYYSHKISLRFYPLICLCALW
jgi:hypothetical protein